VGHEAAAGGHDKLLNYLLQGWGPDVLKQVDSRGRTPSEYHKFTPLVIVDGMVLLPLSMMMMLIMVIMVVVVMMIKISPLLSPLSVHWVARHKRVGGDGWRPGAGGGVL
jgi:hypothetical protein